MKITFTLVATALFLCTSLSLVNAQLEESSDSVSAPDNIISYTDKLGVYVYGISKFSKFELKEEGQKNDSVLRYSPNGNFNIGVGFSHKWMGLGIAFNFGAVNSDAALKGKTSNLDLQLDIYSRRMLFNANFQYYKGYYWQNPNVFFSDWSVEDSLVVRPYISTMVLGLNGIYIFNYKRFSLKAAYQNTERQVKSAGSFLIGSHFSTYAINADSSIVPRQLNEFYPNSNDIGGLGSISFGTSFGYSYTVVLGKYFFINGLTMLGLNAQVLSASDINDELIDSALKLSTKITLRLALGVNKPKAYYGMNFVYDSYFLRNPNNTDLSYSYGKFKIYYGRRFDIKKR